MSVTESWRGEDLSEDELKYLIEYNIHAGFNDFSADQVLDAYRAGNSAGYAEGVKDTVASYDAMANLVGM